MNNLISREDAIKEAYTITIDGESFDVVQVETLEGLPSAQSEIIRCKDCRWWDKSEDSLYGYCTAMKHTYMSASWEIGIYRRYKGDFYCAYADMRGE